MSKINLPAKTIPINPSTIVFFVSGYAADEKALFPLANNLIFDSPRRYVRGPLLNLDRTDCADPKKGIIAFKNETAEIDIQNRLLRISKLAGKTKGKYILINPRLCGRHVDATIELQVSRLMYCIRYLKRDLKTRARIVLIGHSQGGVVNLLTAVRSKGMVDQIISINSPYSEVQPVKDAFTMIRLLHLGDEAFRNYFRQIIRGKITDKQTKNLIENAKVYLTPNYLERLKKNFYKTKDRPRLSLVVSTCGVYNDSLLGWRRSYDGFIPVSSQMDVKYDDVTFLREHVLPCEKNSLLMNTVFDRCLVCRECGMPELKGRFFVKALLQKKSPNDLMNAMVNGGFDAIEGREINPEYKDEPIYTTMYQTYQSPYSHHMIARNKETALVIRQYLEKITGMPARE